MVHRVVRAPKVVTFRPMHTVILVPTRLPPTAGAGLGKDHDMARMDETNVQILQLLQRNGRMSMTDLAHAVGRSESTVRERVMALELGGLLKGYQAQVNWDEAGLPALAIIRARCEISKVQEVAAHLASIPNVTRAILLTGPRPIFAMMRVKDIQHLQQILRSRFAQGELQDLEVELAIQSLVDRRPPSLVLPDEPTRTLIHT